MKPSSSRARPRGARISLDHVVLEVEDPVRSAEFYRRILGLRSVRLGEYKQGRAPFPSARLGPATVVDFFGPKMWRSKLASNPNHFALALSRGAIMALERRLSREGVAVARREDRNFGARGWGHSIYFLDPDRVTVEARYYS